MLYWDHDHNTGVGRDFICGHCNSALGFAKDNEQTLTALAAYIAKHKKENGSTK